jgi:hypothetical protein
MITAQQAQQMAKQIRLNRQSTVVNKPKSTLRGCGALIQDATNCTDVEAPILEEIMRKDIFHSTLDWQTHRQLEKAAIEAYEIYKELKQLGLV